MDNKIFDVNGNTFHKFEKTIELILFDDITLNGSGIIGYKIKPEKGMILYRYHYKKDDITPIENLINDDLIKRHELNKEYRKYKLEKLENDKITIPIKILVSALWEWLITVNMDDIEYGSWEHNLLHDGTNDTGFRVYVEEWEWGRINDEEYSFFAVKPIYCWYGK